MTESEPKTIPVIGEVREDLGDLLDEVDASTKAMAAARTESAYRHRRFWARAEDAFPALREGHWHATVYDDGEMVFAPGGDDTMREAIAAMIGMPTAFTDHSTRPSDDKRKVRLMSCRVGACAHNAKR